MSQATVLLADAETSIKANDWDLALKQLEDLKKDQPNQPEVYEKLAHVLSVRGKFQSVITTYLELIGVLVESEQLEQADGVVSQVLALRPESGEARERRIEIENKRGNVSKAVSLSRELARLCIDQGDGERSIRLLQDAQKHEPRNLDISLELAEMFVSHGHIQDGANQYRKVANAFQESGNIAKAAEAYRRMKVVQSDDPEVLLTLGGLYTELGKLDEAEQEFRSVLRHDLDHEEALLQLGLVCQLKGRFRSGILAFNKVLQNNPNLVSAKRKLGELHHSQGMMTESVDFFLRAAQGYLEVEEKEDAIECFQIVLSVDENNGPAQQGLTNLGAPVQARAFIAPQPPVPVEEEVSADTLPPAPLEPEPVAGGFPSERTERLPVTDFSPSAEVEPPKPEAPPKRPTAGKGNARRGLVGGGLSMKAGLIDPGAGKPMLGDKPMLGGPHGIRRGLSNKSLGGVSGGVGDKPMLGSLSGPGGDRRPSLGTARGESQGALSSGASKASFSDIPPLEDFSADMAFDDVFAEPTSAVSDSMNTGEDMAFSGDSLFDDTPASSSETGMSGFDPDDQPSGRQVSGGPVIGGFVGFDPDEESDSQHSEGLRPSYAPESLGDDLFDFDDDEPTEGRGLALVPPGGHFDEDRALGDDLFGDISVEDDLFGTIDGDDGIPSLQGSPASGLFDDDSSPAEPSLDTGGLFDDSADPFDNLFDEPALADGRVEVAADTLGGAKPGRSEMAFEQDDDGEGASFNEAAFGSLFDEPEPTSTSMNDDFGRAGDLFDDGVLPAGATSSDGGLFSGDSHSNDLFGDDELFSGAGPSETDLPAGRHGSSGDELTDIFSSAQSEISDTDLLAGGEKRSLDFESESLFGEQSSSVGLFDGSTSIDNELFSGSNDEGLFGSADDESSLFGSSSTSTEAQSLNFAAGADPVGNDSGLFDDLGTGSDSLFDAPSEEASGVGAQDSEAILGERRPDGDLFGQQGSGDLFETHGDDLFGMDSSPVSSESGASGRIDPGAEFGAGSLFDEPDSSMFDLPAVGDLAEAEARAVEHSANDDDLFAESEKPLGGLFASVEDREPAPLGLDLPMPGDEPIFSASGEEASKGDFPSDSLFDEDADSGEGSSMDPGFFDSEPLSFDIPEPDAEPLSFDHSEFQTEPLTVGFSEPDAEPLSFDIPEPDAEPLSFDIPEPDAEPLSFEIPEPDAEPLSFDSAEPESGSSNFGSSEAEQAGLLSTFDSLEPDGEPLSFDIPLPMVEEEPAQELEPIPMSSGELTLEQPEEEIFGDSLGFDDFEPSQDVLEPDFGIAISSDSFEGSFDEGSQAEEELVVDVLSSEERAELAHTSQADSLEESLAGADVASKIAAYRKSLEENPDNLVLRTRLADIHLKYGLLEDAVVQYRQVMRRNPESIPLLHRVIQAEFWNENYVEAGDSLLALAHLHLKRGEQHEALDALQSVLSLDPLHSEARRDLVSVFTSLEESKLAAHHLRQLAETALTKGEVSGAISAFQQLLEISDDPTFEERLAQIYEGQGDVDRALASFQSLVGRYRAEERWEEAARVTERIVELDPSQLEDRDALISLYQRLGFSEQAVQQQFLLARLYQERNELEPAIGLYEDVLRYQVGNFDARRCLVDAYLDSGKVTLALEQAESLTEHYLDTKDHSTAIYLYTRLVEADPENVELQERLVKFYGLAGDSENAKTRWISLSLLHEAKGRYEKAAEAIRKALELEEGQTDLQYRLALLFAERLADNPSALEQLRKIFQSAPERLDAVNMYIDLLLKEEQVSEAGQVLQKLEQGGGEGVEIKSNVIASLRASVEANPSDLKGRFNYGELCYHLGDLDHAIEQFQQTRRHPDFELMSYNMLGLCFASKRGYMMLDLAIKQFKKGLETKGRSEQDYLEIRYNLAMVQYQNGRASEALAELKECYNADIAYRDVRSWIQRIEGELASSGS